MVELLWSEMVPPMFFIMLFCYKVAFLHCVWVLINNLGRNSRRCRMCLRSYSSDNSQKTDPEKISLQMSGQKIYDRGVLGSLAFCLWGGLEFCSIHPGRSNITLPNIVLLHIDIKRRESCLLYYFFLFLFFSTRLFFTKINFK